MSDTAAAAVIGGISGICEINVGQPLIYFKNCLQTKAPIQFKPSVLYRGYGVNVATLAPITAFQVAVTGLTYNTFFRPPGPQTTPQKKELHHMAISSAIAGGLSGFIAGPTEIVILQQQQTGLGAIDTMKSIINKAGLRGLYRGTQYCMIRDAGFSCGFMAVGPYLTDRFAASPHFNDFTAPLAGGLAAGIFSAIVTHPFDTLKTRYQNDFQKVKYQNVLQAARDGSVFQGMSARGTRVITGTIIISNVTRILNNQYQQRFNSSTIPEVAKI